MNKWLFTIKKTLIDREINGILFFCPFKNFSECTRNRRTIGISFIILLLKLKQTNKDLFLVRNSKKVYLDSVRFLVCLYKWALPLKQKENVDASNHY